LSDKDLSIIIVNYKSWGVLQQCLDSFNRYPPKLNYEIVVVDNDSQDGQLGPFSQKYPTVKFVNNSGNYGFCISFGDSGLAQCICNGKYRGRHCESK